MNLSGMKQIFCRKLEAKSMDLNIAKPLLQHLKTKMANCCLPSEYSKQEILFVKTMKAD
nr:MAG TPA: hypothetical protein [Caudoviricetes sp.]